jgi:hypothetical protein
MRSSSFDPTGFVVACIVSCALMTAITGRLFHWVPVLLGVGTGLMAAKLINK